MSKLLTISVAAYNVEDYLEKTLCTLNDSRFNDDIEVLIIDDGSKDNTSEIALKYQKLVPGTFRYVYKENGGHGSTINKSIELASGKYFKVIDGDDWIDPDVFASFISRLKKTDVDLVLTPYKKVCENTSKLETCTKSMVDQKIYSWDNNFNINKYMTIHMMTIKTSLLRNNVHITEKCYYVDMEFVVWAIYLSKNIAYWNLPVYMYRVGIAGQSVNKKNMLKNISMLERVSYNIVDLYEKFSNNESLACQKRNAIFNIVVQITGSTVRTYLLLDSIKEVKTCIFQFEEKIKKKSEKVYNELGTIRFFRAIRYGHYKYLFILRELYNIWILKYKIQK